MKKKEGKEGQKTHIRGVRIHSSFSCVCVCVFQLWQNEGSEWLHHSALSTCHQNTSLLGVCSSGPRSLFVEKSKGARDARFFPSYLKPRPIYLLADMESDGMMGLVCLCWHDSSPAICCRGGGSTRLTNHPKRVKQTCSPTLCDNTEAFS